MNSKIYNIIGLLCFPIMALAQSPLANENYIKTTVYHEALPYTNSANDTNIQKNVSVQYFDGLGRLYQQVGIKQGGNQEDIITHFDYDIYGRQQQEFLPYATDTNNGVIRTNVRNELDSFYDTEKYENTQNYYSKKSYDGSPLNRVTQQAAPGEDWAENNNHTIKHEYGTNSVGEVIKFNVNLTLQNHVYKPLLSRDPNYDGFYKEGTLQKRIVKDENWVSGKLHTQEEFIDSYERVVLKRTYSSPTNLEDNLETYDTYYVYDNYGNLSYVLPPKLNALDFDSLGIEIDYSGYAEYFEGSTVPLYTEHLNSFSTLTFSVEDGLLTGTLESNNTPGRKMVDAKIYDCNFPIDLPDADLGYITIRDDGDRYYFGKLKIEYGDFYIDHSDYFSSTEPVYYDFTHDFELEVNVPTHTLSGFSDTRLNKLAYQYTYDHRNRLVEKKLPGKDVEYIVYDDNDRPILIQDANLRAENKWLFTKYDVFGRSIATGIYMHGTNDDQQAMQTIVDNYYLNNSNIKFYESKLGNAYTNHTYPTSNTETLTINYYDNYTFAHNSENIAALQTVLGQDITTKTQSLATGSKIKVLDTNNWITTVTYYDERARPIYVHSENEYLNSVDITKTQYNFIGNVLKTRQSHTIGTQSTIVTQNVFTYDHANRLLDQHQCIGDDTLDENCGSLLQSPHEDKITLSDDLQESTTIIGNNEIILEDGFHFEAEEGVTFTASIFNRGETGELIAKNEYDELGQLVAKKVGNSADSPLQTVDYTYNVRGWLKQINDPTQALTDDLFAFNINYNTSSQQGVKALYNGNISETYWRTNNVDNNLKYYTYGYDALNRITQANDNTGNYNLNSIAYDKNGNILNLNRQGNINTGASVFGVMDNLTYTYDTGNKLLGVADMAASTGFKDGTNTGDDYVYDANGNMIEDKNKGITSIAYNHLNLPKEVVFDNTANKKITYLYDAVGMKLQKMVNDNGAITTTDYVGGFKYVNNKLEFFDHTEGYVEPINPDNLSEGFKYVYQYKDHLGNIRLSYADLNKDGSIDKTTEIQEEKNYYPFGLQHRGYNSTIKGRQNKFKTFQGQEFHDELGLKIHEWKYRMSDPALGRFWQLDPLAESYVYNSPYAFQENKLGLGTELEGAELKLFSWLSSDSTYESYNRGGENLSNNNFVNSAGSVCTTGCHNIQTTGENVNFGGAIRGFMGNIGLSATILDSGSQLLGKSSMFGNYSGPLAIGTAIVGTLGDYHSGSSTNEFTQNSIQTAIETYVGLSNPVASLSIHVNLQDAKTSDGLTNLSNGRLANSYMSSYNQIMSQTNQRIVTNGGNINPSLQVMGDALTEGIKAFINKYLNTSGSTNNKKTNNEGNGGGVGIQSLGGGYLFSGNVKECWGSDCN